MMAQIFTQEEVEFIRGVGMKLIAGEETTKEEDSKIRELSNRLAEENKKQEGAYLCGD